VRLLVFALALAAAACEPVLPPGSELVPGSPLVVVVTRYGSIEEKSAVEAWVAATDLDAVRRLQQEANSLPRFPGETIFCPFDEGSHYRVEFVYANGAGLTLFAEIRGCRGVGPTYDGHWTNWSAIDHRFLDDLERISPPG